MKLIVTVRSRYLLWPALDFDGTPEPALAIFTKINNVSKLLSRDYLFTTAVNFSCVVFGLPNLNYLSYAIEVQLVIDRWRGDLIFPIW